MYKNRFLEISDLKFIAKYLSKDNINEVEYLKLKTLILNLLPISVAYPEFTESSYELAMKEIYKVINSFETKEEIIQDGSEIFQETKNIIQSIRYGEQVFFLQFLLNECCLPYMYFRLYVRQEEELLHHCS